MAAKKKTDGNVSEGSELAIFQEKGIQPALQKRIEELDPEFAKRSRGEQEEILDFLKERAEATLEGVKSRFPVVSVKHAGAGAIELPKSPGEDEGPLVRELTCVILDQYLTKGYWAQGLGKGSSGGPPDCASMDAITPYTKNPVSPSCVTCQYNKFGSGIDNEGNPTRGKRCRDIKRVVVKLDGHDLPARLALSPKNLKNFDAYMNDLRDQGRTIGTVVTKIRARNEESASGPTFTALHFSTERELSMTEVLELKRNCVDPFKQDFRMGAIEIDEADEGGAKGPPPEETSGGEKAADVMG